MLAPEDWRPRAARHAERADRATAAHRARRAAGERHAVEDFLYEYYPTRPAGLRRWHPGAGVTLAAGPGPDGVPPLADARWYRQDADGAVALDLAAFRADRGEGVAFVARLLAATAARPALLGCFGLHEWAMVYRDRGALRHPLPLRLGPEGTDAVVEGQRLRCTHADAFRFFTPEAVPRNALRPTRAEQVALEQPGCLHAGMDLLKWALKLGPAAPGELLLDCFDLARDVRVLDMRASPYDVSSYGLAPVAVETPDGRAEYVRQQRGFADRAAALRVRLLAVCARVLPDEVPGPGTATAPPGA
ncbi:3-methyladenine DNA glycosylase [Cellulomonas endophytica]|uniref:3-methyladenine DNA glycosylase n=1 Tax=Cellulomonas endophytica TaxID=2494735 RepID=UPI001013BA8D